MTPVLSTKRAARAAVLAIAFAAFTSPLSAQRPRYTLQDLNAGDNMSSTAVAINDNGDVAGWVEINRSTRAARTRFGRPFEIVRALEHVMSSASDINAAGDLAGSMLTSADPWTFVAMTYSDSAGVWGPGSLGGSSHGVGINRSGQVAGWSQYQWGSNNHAFIWTPGQGIFDLGAGGFGSSYATGINDLGQVAGHLEASGGRWHAFRFTPGYGVQDLGTPADANTFAAGINASGQIVGRLDRFGASTHAFRYTDVTGFQNLHTCRGDRAPHPTSTTRATWSAICSPRERRRHVRFSTPTRRAWSTSTR
jgi:probable HAF family extracellular repeat protein